MSKTRSAAPPNVDKEVFRRTASKTKAINLGSKIFRGGIRL